MKKNNDSKQKTGEELMEQYWLGKLRDSIKCNNICMIGVSEAKGREKGGEVLYFKKY